MSIEVKDTVEITTLDNGLTVITDTIKTVASMTAGIWCKTGGRYENEQQCGIAHFLEHMVFKGTKSRSSREISLEIENAGGSMNAYTSNEITAYYARALSEDKAKNTAFDIVSDILLNPMFDKAEMEKERGVILQEINMYYDDHSSRAYDLYQQTAYGDTSLGRPILGPSENIERFQTEDIINFMKTYYAPNNLVFAAAGNISHEETVRIAKEKFGHLSKGNSNICQEMSYQGGIMTQERDIEQVQFFCGFEAPALTADDYQASRLLAAILGSGMSSRLFQEIREERGLVYTVSAGVQSYMDTGSLYVYAGTGPDELKELVPALCEQLKDVQENISDEELKKVKTRLRAGTLMSLESVGGRCRRNASSYIHHGEIKTIQDFIKEIDAITKNDVIEVARKVFSGQPTLSAVGKLDNMPGLKDITNSVKL